MFSKIEEFEKNYAEEEVLKEISTTDDITGGSTAPCGWIISGTISATVSVCPTTKCTSKCGK